MNEELSRVEDLSEERLCKVQILENCYWILMNIADNWHEKIVLDEKVLLEVQKSFERGFLKMNLEFMRTLCLLIN